MGGGSWGTALSAHLARSGHDVRLWLRSPDVARAINERRENPVYLPGVTLPAGLQATTDLAAATFGAETAFVVIPSEYCRAIYRQLRDVAPPGLVLVSATKGIETDTLSRMTEVAAREAPGHPLAVVSGPSFALEVAQGQPTTVVVAAPDLSVAEAVQRVLSSRTFRAYSSHYVGAGVRRAQNVIAIARDHRRPGYSTTPGASSPAAWRR